MPDPAASGQATGHADENAALSDLRRLLVGEELAQLAALHERVADPARRTADLAEALPSAIRGAKAKPLREALEPVFEKAFFSSVRKNPKELADAIYPIIGPAIRTSIGAAIRDFTEALNQIVEKSISLRSIKWRVESIITGKPFAEILMARSMMYSVEQMFLIHRKSGLLLQHVAAQGSVLKDADMISGMLTAIQDFLSDSFTEGGQDLETVDAGRFKLWMTYSPKILLVAAVGGTAPVELRGVFRKALDRIEDLLQAETANFKQDDLSVFEPAKPVLESCLLGNAGETKEQASLWPWVAGIAVLILAFIGWRVVVQSRWDSYFEALRKQPGIVVTNIEKTGGAWLVSGLKDPDTQPPASLLKANKLDASGVRFAWQPYLSLNTPFSEMRERGEADGKIHRQIIRFDTNSSKLPVSEAGRIEDLADAIVKLRKTVPAAQIEIKGHADETGSPATNEKLSIERAKQVADALVSLGIPRENLIAIGVGNTNPLRKGASDWDRATNRGVSASVVMGLP